MAVSSSSICDRFVFMRSSKPTGDMCLGRGRFGLPNARRSFGALCGVRRRTGDDSMNVSDLPGRSAVRLEQNGAAPGPHRSIMTVAPPPRPLSTFPGLRARASLKRVESDPASKRSPPGPSRRPWRTRALPGRSASPNRTLSTPATSVAKARLAVLERALTEILAVEVEEIARDKAEELAAQLCFGVEKRL
jgi:hypothetical protein